FDTRLVCLLLRGRDRRSDYHDSGAGNLRHLGDAHRLVLSSRAVSRLRSARRLPDLLGAGIVVARGASGHADFPAVVLGNPSGAVYRTYLRRLRRTVARRSTARRSPVDGHPAPVHDERGGGTYGARRDGPAGTAGHHTPARRSGAARKRSALRRHRHLLYLYRPASDGGGARLRSHLAHPFGSHALRPLLP